ncbi:hypothetical protein BJX66DRAFT_326055 [Aspergillus keveii]|uniref:Rhodopsin domain-containing protein n=1 Tax=Aspergillus keveii TaxID=714993 RepID=A0ABR4G302_9EURO
MDATGLIANMTAEQMANTPAGRPPPGIISRLVNPPSDGYILVVVGSIVMAITLTAAMLRFYAKIAIRKKMRPDDWTTLVATVGSIGYYSNCILAVVRGKYGVHLWDLSIAHVMSDLFIISSYFLNWVAAIMWCFAKSSFFLMYLDIFSPVAWQRYAIHFGFALARLLASPRYRRNFHTMMPIVIGSFLIDMYIFLLPMMFVSPLQMSLRKKLGVLAVFATGLLACVASALRIYYTDLLGKHTDDFTYYSLRVLVMCLLEMCAGVTASCMPSMVLLYRRRGPGKERQPPRLKGGASSRSWVELKPYQKSPYATLVDNRSGTHYQQHVETRIESGSGTVNGGGELDDGQIHLRYGLVQNASTHEVV